MTFLEILETIVLAVSLLSTVIALIVRAVKEHWLKQLKDTIVEAMHYAQDNIVGPGEKKQYVIAKVKDKAEELKIPFNVLANKISELIDNIKANYNAVKKGE